MLLCARDPCAPWPGAHDCLPTLGVGARTPGVTGAAASRRCGALRAPAVAQRCQHGGVPDLSRMRSDYDAGRLREEDLAPDLGRAVRPLVRRRRRRRAAGAQRVVVATADADGAPDARRRADEGLRRERLRLRHQLRLGQGRAARGQPAGGAGLPLARAAAPGAGDRPRRADRRDARPTRCGTRGRAARSWPRRRRCSRRSSTPGEELVRAGAAARRADAGGPGAAAGGLGRLPGGAATAWSSGRAARDRLHDRLRFVRDDEEGGGWIVQRLAP